VAKRAFTVGTWTPTAVADATNFTDGGYCALQGGSSTQLTKITEVYMGGQAASSSPCIMVLGRDSTIGVTLAALASPNCDGPLHPSTAALAAPVLPFVASTTKPQRATSISVGKFNMSFNAFGGIVHYIPPVDGEFWILGNTASNGEASLSAFTGGTPGLMGSTITYESL
jgi:hypothetical protein